jgi:hypothetical protein
MKRSLAVAAGALALSLSALPARAANDTRATALFGVLGGEKQQTLGAAVNGFFAYSLVSGRSYVAFCWQPGVEAGGSCSVEIQDNTGAVVSTAANGEPNTMAGGHTGDADALIPSASGTFYVRVTNNLGGATDTRMIMVETTLFSPWYFVSATNGYNGFIEIRNNTSSSITPVVTVYRDNGTVAGTNSPVIAANGTALVQANALNPDGFGSVQIAYRGMPGAIAGNITTLSATTGLSFDSPFSPRMSWAMAPF